MDLPTFLGLYLISFVLGFLGFSLLGESRHKCPPVAVCIGFFLIPALNVLTIIVLWPYLFYLWVQDTVEYCRDTFPQLFRKPD